MLQKSQPTVVVPQGNTVPLRQLIIPRVAKVAQKVGTESADPLTINVQEAVPPEGSGVRRERRVINAKVFVQLGSTETLGQLPNRTARSAPMEKFHWWQDLLPVRVFLI